MINKIDAQILNILQQNSRISNAEIARQIKMAPSAVLERIKKLEKNKIIKKYTVQIEASEVDKELLAYVLVKANGPIVDNKTAKELAKVPEVQEVHIVAGEDCFLVKVRAENPAKLTELLRKKIASINSISSTSTTIVLETVKETTDLVF
ncbi:MAG TPA: Lrp/AsnC family transcriptional regulator [Ignavibacteriaceae bacterium]|nr:Lrp/AsnC family transcriptional regulator [Ignavibacteriaceae bacterium]